MKNVVQRIAGNADTPPVISSLLSTGHSSIQGWDRQHALSTERMPQVRQSGAAPRFIKQVTPRDAWDFVKANPRAVFIDVRSDLEFLLIGHALSSHCIPWIDDEKWQVNPHFVTEVRAIAVCDTPIVLICRSGNRSAAAAAALLAAGFQQIYDVSGGFEGECDARQHRSTLNGWRYFGLPWEQC